MGNRQMKMSRTTKKMLEKYVVKTMNIRRERRNSKWELRSDINRINQTNYNIMYNIQAERIEQFP